MTRVRSLAVGHAFVIGGLESDSERQLEVGGTGAVAADLFEGFPKPHSVTYIGPKRSAAPPCAIRARGRGGHVAEVVTVAEVMPKALLAETDTEYCTPLVNPRFGEASEKSRIIQAENGWTMPNSCEPPLSTANCSPPEDFQIGRPDRQGPSGARSHFLSEIAPVGRVGEHLNSKLQS